MIYFIQAGDVTRPIKIGYAQDVAARIPGIQTGCPDELRLLAVMDGDKETEAALHSLMAFYRIRGEWFRPVPVLLDLIAAVSIDDTAAMGRSIMAQIRCRRSPRVLVEASPEKLERYIILRERIAVQRAQTCGA